MKKRAMLLVVVLALLVSFAVVDSGDYHHIEAGRSVGSETANQIPLHEINLDMLLL